MIRWSSAFVGKNPPPSIAGNGEYQGYLAKSNAGTLPGPAVCDHQSVPCQFEQPPSQRAESFARRCLEQSHGENFPEMLALFA